MESFGLSYNSYAHERRNFNNVNNGVSITTGNTVTI